MKLADMLSAITSLHISAKRMFDSALDAYLWCDQIGSMRHDLGHLETLYGMAFDHAKKHGTRSERVWNLIREMHGWIASVRGYIADNEARLAARAAKSAEVAAVAEEVAAVAAEVAEIKAKVDEIAAEVAEITGEDAPGYLPEPPAEIILPEGCRVAEPAPRSPLQIWGSGTRNHKTGVATPAPRIPLPPEWIPSAQIIA
jgi:hypothetical protein